FMQGANTSTIYNSVRGEDVNGLGLQAPISDFCLCVFRAYGWKGLRPWILPRRQSPLIDRRISRIRRSSKGRRKDLRIDAIDPGIGKAAVPMVAFPVIRRNREVGQRDPAPQHQGGVRPIRCRYSIKSRSAKAMQPVA